jgi:curved DNA-binding protein CbpA
MALLATLQLSEEQKEEINEAYSVLIDPELRAQYNHRKLYFI